MSAQDSKDPGRTERAARTNLFVLASLSVAEAAMPVKVRNVAEFGALVEGASLPPAATQVRLRRGELDVPASVAWSERGRAGLAFDNPVPVSVWLPGKSANTRQPMVDHVVQQIRESRPELPTMNAVDLQASGVSIDDLHRLRAEIHALAEALAADPTVIKLHAVKLQSLDLASQLLEKLIAPPAVSVE